MGAHHRRAYVCNLGYVNTKVDCDVRRHTRDSRHKSDTPRQHKTHTSKGKSKATARRERIRLKPSKGPSGCLGSAGEGRMHAKPGTRLSSDGAATPSPPTSTHTHTSTYTALQNASNDASSSTRRRCRRGWTPKRGGAWVERGWTPLPCALDMRTAFGCL